MKLAPEVMPEIDRIDSVTYHNPEVIALAVGGSGVPRPVQHLVDHSDCKRELGNFGEMVQVHNTIPGSSRELEFNVRGEAQRASFEVQ